MEENYQVSVSVKKQGFVSKATGFIKQKTYQVAVAAAVGVMGVTGANAADPITLAVPDMAPIVALIMGMVALVASIGMAVLSVYATGKVFKWVKAAF